MKVSEHRRGKEKDDRKHLKEDTGSFRKREGSRPNIEGLEDASGERKTTKFVLTLRTENDAKGGEKQFPKNYPTKHAAK